MVNGHWPEAPNLEWPLDFEQPDGIGLATVRHTGRWPTEHRSLIEWLETDWQGTGFTGGQRLRQTTANVQLRVHWPLINKTERPLGRRPHFHDRLAIH